MTDEQPLPQAIGASSLVAGRYELEHSLGTGGMGEVFAATDRTLDREVALKRLPVALTDDVEARKRFFREAQALARINDPHVVPVYDAGDDGGRPYLVMQLVHGPTLADELRTSGPFTAARASAIGADIAAGLAAAHAKGVIHRDVKPSNIFLTRDGHAMIGDFGIARFQRGDMTLTMTGQAFGSPPYMAPEQATGDMVDARADIYSLGCVLFHMLTGRPPFEGDDSVAVTYQHVHSVAPSLESFGVAVSPVLSGLVATMLRKDPAARPRSADAVRLALESAAGGAAETAPLIAAAGPVSTDRTRVMPQRTSRTPKRRRWWVWPAIAGALVLLLIAGVAWSLAGDPSTKGAGRSPRASAVASAAQPSSVAPASSTAPTSSPVPASSVLPSPASTGSSPTTPQQAAAVIFGLTRALSVVGAISDGLAQDIRTGVASAIEHADEPDEVNGILHDLHDKIRGSVADGAASNTAASQLSAAIAFFADLLHHGDGNDNGNSQGNGEGQD
jgi:serine/threonine protein kinase